MLLGFGQRAPLLSDLGGDFLDRDTGVGSLDLVTALCLKDEVRAERALGLVFACHRFCYAFGLTRRGKVSN